MTTTRIIVAAYVASCLIVAIIRNQTLYLWVRNFVLDATFAPLRLIAMLLVKPDPNAKGGDITIGGGRGKGTGAGGSIILQCGDSDAGPKGTIKIDGVEIESGDRMKVIVNGRSRTIRLDN